MWGMVYFPEHLNAAIRMALAIDTFNTSEGVDILPIFLLEITHRGRIGCPCMDQLPARGPSLVRIIACCLFGAKPLSESIISS